MMSAHRGANSFSHGVMLPYFTPSNVRYAYANRFHFNWDAFRHQPLFEHASDALGLALDEVAVRRDYHLLEHAFTRNCLRALVSLRPFVSPAEATRFIKGNLASVARRERQIHSLWSRGSFFRSIGQVTNDVVADYVANQYDHHEIAAPATMPKASYRHPGEPGQLRHSSHVTYEYNSHYVFVTHRRRELLDEHSALGLMHYWLRVCELKRWIPWNIEVVWNHAHLFLGLNPTDSPGAVALSLLNNSEHYLQRKYPGVWRDAVERTIWMPGFYTGTVGSATTAQIKAFLG